MENLLVTFALVKCLLTNRAFPGRHLALLSSACCRYDAHQPLYQFLPTPPLSGNPSWYFLWSHFRSGPLCHRSLLLQEASHGHGLRIDWLSDWRYHLSFHPDQFNSEPGRGISLGSACLRLRQRLPARNSCSHHSSNDHEKEG